MEDEQPEIKEIKEMEDEQLEIKEEIKEEQSETKAALTQKRHWHKGNTDVKAAMSRHPANRLAGSRGRAKGREWKRKRAKESALAAASGGWGCCWRLPPPFLSSCRRLPAGAAEWRRFGAGGLILDSQRHLTMDVIAAA